MAEELLQLVDRRGNPAGTALRSACHGNPGLIQAVVHLHLFDRSGRLYLQRRAGGKERFPGRWDTSVGGHMAAGESPQQAIRREAREELGIDLDDVAGSGGLQCLQSYLYSDEIETEYVSAFRCVGERTPRPNPEEVAGGAFFELEEIRRRLDRRPGEFTPHFQLAFERLLSAG